MEFLTKGQTDELNKLATVYSNNESKKKGFFPKRKMKPKDITKIIKNRNRVKHTFQSVLKAPSVIREHDSTKEYKTSISKREFTDLDSYIRNTLQMDSWGVACFEEKEIFKGDGIPYQHVIVMSKHMKNDTFVVKELPNMDCMLEVIEVYGDTGVASLEVTDYLRDLGFGALPNHSLGGNIDYTKAALKANLGFVGKHGMLITPSSGPCNRISVVYTSITNLSEYLNNHEDYSWGKEFCSTCKKCVRTCPHHAIYEEAKIDEYGHTTCISNELCNSGFSHYGCAICIAACPFTKIGYPKIKDAFLQQRDTF